MKDSLLASYLFGSLILILFSIYLILFLIRAKRKQQKHEREKLTLAHIYQQQLMQSKLEVQEQSFKYFSEEIHDNVGQILSLTSMNLHQLNESVLDAPNKERLHSCQELLTNAIQDLRTISHALNAPLIAKLGLIDALKKEVIYIKTAKKIECDFVILGEPFSNTAEQELMAFRIIQQAISNALKHANATKITLQVAYETNGCYIAIIDNGKGFFTEDCLLNKGIGLDNMKARAHLIGHTFKIQSTPQMGTTISFIVNRLLNG